MLRFIIGSDMDLARLFTMQPEPTVYLLHNQNIKCTQSEPFTVHDVMTQPQSSTNYHTNTQPIRIPTFLNLITQCNLHSTQQMRILSALEDQTSCQMIGGGFPFHDARNDDTAVDDNVHDFTTWIHRECGINELLSMLVPTNQPTSSHNQVEPEAEDHMCNLDLGSVGARNVRAKAVAAYYARKMHHEKRIMKSWQSCFMSLGFEQAIKLHCEHENAAISMIYGGHVISQCPVSRFSFPTSNIAESFNLRLLFARHLPIVSTIEAIRHVMEKWFDQRCAVSRARADDLTEETHNKLALEVNKGDRLKVVARTCECREFQDDLMPCSHTFAAIRNQCMSVYDFVSVCYKTKNWKELYATQVNPLPLEDDWSVPSEVKHMIVLPPIVLRQAGRPRG
ncbi:hypothetical protein C2S51_017641 [Perilla frutescens var. frutescens]|nr:hypothetical protein C2S51_017641 [Perilla frutescens var. frutescens]